MPVGNSVTCDVPMGRDADHADARAETGGSGRSDRARRGPDGVGGPDHKHLTTHTVLAIGPSHPIRTPAVAGVRPARLAVQRWSREPRWIRVIRVPCLPSFKGPYRKRDRDNVLLRREHRDAAIEIGWIADRWARLRCRARDGVTNFRKASGVSRTQFDVPARPAASARHGRSETASDPPPRARSSGRSMRQARRPPCRR
jgi:hypothetical protein